MIYFNFLNFYFYLLNKNKILKKLRPRQGHCRSAGAAARATRADYKKE